MPAHEPRAIIIGCGVAGIALSARLKKDLNYSNFIVYEREAQIGGTWFLNTYPGVGCDVDSHLYSFSFNPNPNWSKRFAEQPEILEYLNSTVDKFGIRPHVRCGIEVVEARWDESGRVWRVQLRDFETGYTFHREAEILVSCVGTISIPKDCDIPKWESFNGAIWHSARWNHEYDLTGRTVAVVGNGCSAAQLVPQVVKHAKKVFQFQRSAQWVTSRVNREFTALEKWCFRYIPLLARWYRFKLWKDTDALHTLYMSDTPALVAQRERATRSAVEYIKQNAPAKYHDVLVPQFPLGCKRRIFDPGYLSCLYKDNIELTSEPIVEFFEGGLRTPNRDIAVDAVVLSTGFKIQQFLSPITVYGRHSTLNEHWQATRGAQAYKGTFVAGFPNFGIIFGPNAFPAHNSVIYTNEVQVEYLIKAMFRPVLAGHFATLEVKEAAEMYDANALQGKLKNMVWSGGCSNWNLDTRGRNTTNYPDNTWKFWWQLYWPRWRDFDIGGDTGRRPWHPLQKVVVAVAVVSLALGGAYHRQRFLR
ncbi:flavin-containing monooxygenase [Aspergillus lucknowensis]|uniref:Monooxygenase n=1 Tax=Aspergillus lucknowensis TaxID=176173 RepID=A0ABR4LID5_9EURO